MSLSHASHEAHDSFLATSAARAAQNGYDGVDSYAAEVAREAFKTLEHAAFLRVLRRGYRDADSAAGLIKTMADVDPGWHLSHLANQANKTMTEADDTTGGVLASATFADAILHAMQNASPVRQVVTVIPVRGNGTGSLVPVRSGVQTARRVSEVGTRVLTGNDLSFTLENAPTHEMYALTAISHALLADSKYPLDSELADGATQAFRLLEGKEFISGDGVGEMLGLNTATNIPASNLVQCADSSGHTVTPDDILRLVYKSVAAPYISGGRLLLNPKLLGTLRGLKATSGNTFLNPVQDTPDTYLGIPVSLLPDLDDNSTPAAGKIVAYFLHPLAYALVVREEIVVQRLPERFIDEGKVGFAIWARTGGSLVLPAAVARLTTA